MTRLTILVKRPHRFCARPALLYQGEADEFAPLRKNFPGKTGVLNRAGN
jgi:hypothetical protein